MGVGGSGDGVEVEVEKGTEREEEECGNQERTEVLDDEDGAPGDLGSCWMFVRMCFLSCGV